MPALFEIEYHSQPPTQHRNIRLTPFVRTIRLRFPRIPGGFVWSKPTSLLVSYPDGHEQVLPVPDMTRKYLILTLLSGLCGCLAFSFLKRRLKARSDAGQRSG